MDKKILHIKEYQLVVVLDKDNKLLLSYDSIDGLELTSEGILKAVNDELNLKISQYFKIDIEDYGVTVVCENMKLMEDKK